jgi:NhaP-type Na+/H+ or K+/H+ antiporter
MKTNDDKAEKKVNGDQSNKVLSLLVPILLLPTIVLTGYLAAFLHEIGYTSLFGIPIDLIRIDPTAMMTSLPPVLLLAFLLLLSAAIWAIVYWVNRKLLVQKKPSSVRLLLWWAGFDAIITTAFIYSAIRQYYGPQSAYISAGLLIFECIPLLVSISIYGKRTNNDSHVELDKELPKIWELYKKPSTLLAFILLGVASLCLLAWVGGTTDALFTRSYLEPSVPAKSVVLRIYGDNVICASINDSNQIERSFFVLKLDEPTLILTFHQYDSPFGVVPVKTEKH